MRVVSMVPSWTETLIAAGVNVVGRTHFCIHPADQVKNIPAVGGTKNVNREKLKSLRPDILILDKEENPRSMSELELPFFATHVRGAGDVAPALQTLSEILKAPKLTEFSERWRRAAEPKGHENFWSRLPVTEWLKPLPPLHENHRIIYVIWREPWMAVSRETFIGSMLELLGAPGGVPSYAEKYPKLTWDEMNQPGNVLLFSSEPYDFVGRRAKIHEFGELKCPAALIEGEPLSWYGLRSLKFIEDLKW